jgi:hypothetical protein
MIKMTIVMTFKTKYVKIIVVLEMKRIKIISIIIFAVIGALLIYNHFNTEEFRNSLPNKISKAYGLDSKTVVYESANIDEVINIIANKYGIIFMCTPETKWCKKYAELLNEVAIEKDVDKIYYLNIKNERSMNTNKYQKLVNQLEDVLFTDDTGNKRIYMPEVVFVRDGKIIAHDNETSFITNDQTVSDYWTPENINKFKVKLYEYIDLLNTIEENNETTDNSTLESEE